MPLLLLALPFVLVLAVMMLMPLLLFQRYRMGTARRLARSWLATANIVAMTLSVAFFMTVAAVTAIFVADAFTYALSGLLCGCAVGLPWALAEPLGARTRDAPLHPQPVVGARHHPGRDGTDCLRCLARVAHLARQRR